jgi:hypothetical protein
VFTIDQNLSGVCRHRASDDLDQRRFARAILAHQRMHFTLTNFKTDPSQGVDAVVRLIDLVNAQQNSPGIS